MVKTDPKKVPSQKLFFARSSRYNCPTFYEKKKSHFTTPLMERVTYDFNLEKIAPLRRAKCNSAEIGKQNKKKYLKDKWENSVQNHFLTNFVSHVVN